MLYVICPPTRIKQQLPNLRYVLSVYNDVFGVGEGIVCHFSIQLHTSQLRGGGQNHIVCPLFVYVLLSVEQLIFGTGLLIGCRFGCRFDACTTSLLSREAGGT